MKKWITILTLMTVIITGFLFLTAPKAKEPKASFGAETASPANALNLSNLAKSVPSIISSGSAESKLSKTLRTQGEKMNQMSANAAQDEQELESLAAGLSQKDGQELMSIALDPSRFKNERFLAVYLLGKRGKDFVPQLAAIGASKSALLASQPGPHTAALIAKNSEVSIAIEALKGLDSVVKEPGQDLAPVFQNIQNESPSITVRQIARVGYVGAVRGEPLVRKYIDSKLQAVLR